MFGEIVKNNQSIHAIVHEPFTYGRPGEWSQILAGGRIGSRGRDNDGVRHRFRFFEHRDDAGDGGLLLTYRDIDAVERTIVLVTGCFSRFVETSLVKDGVDTDGRLARRTVADDQFTLAPANRNHGVNGHYPRLHRLSNRAALDDARSEFFDRINRLTPDRPFAI